MSSGSTNDPQFDAFVGVDWSGAKTAKGIAIALADAWSDDVTLVSPPHPATRWTRGAAAEWLALEMARRRLLVGVDFALSLPVDPGIDWAPSARELWRLVDATCKRADGAGLSGQITDDFYARTFVDTPPHFETFWTRGARPLGFAERSRQTEIACAEQGHGSPQTPFKLIEAKQVGLGSLSGMRVLHHLGESAKGSPFVWPIDGRLPPPGRSVVVEIFPRLFLRQAGHGNRKVRSRCELDPALTHFGGRWVNPGPHPLDLLSDHDTDALVAACGLRAAATDHSWWDVAPPSRKIAFEGWIFGVDGRG